MYLEGHSHYFMHCFSVKKLSGKLLGPAFNEIGLRAKRGGTWKKRITGPKQGLRGQVSSRMTTRTLRGLPRRRAAWACSRGCGAQPRNPRVLFSILHLSLRISLLFRSVSVCIHHFHIADRIFSTFALVLGCDFQVF